MRIELNTINGLIIYPNAKLGINEEEQYVSIFVKYKKRAFRSSYFFHEIKLLKADGVEIILRRSKNGD